MKKIFSLIIALTLLVSIFAVSAVAMADETRTITVGTTGNEYLMNKVGNEMYLEDVKDFKGWLTTTADVTSVFTGINFVMKGDQNFDANAKYDTVRLEYCTGDARFEDNWKDDEKTLIVGEGGTSFDLKLSGWVAFRYSVAYKPSTTAEETKVTTDTFVLYVVDTTAPVVEKGTSLSDKELDGIKVGSSYTVSTSSTSIKVTDSSNYTTTYIINKLIDGKYVQVYSSVDGLSEDYEGTDISNGTIKPTADDVFEKATYQVVYSVVDANGYKSADLVAEFKVIPNDEDIAIDDKMETWKIILFCIAGASAVAIVVLVFFVKPKKETNTRILYTEDTNNTDNK